LGGAIGVASSGERISGAGDSANAGAVAASMTTPVRRRLVKASEDCAITIPRIISTEDASTALVD
jgi:hypothetical protein